MDFSHPVLATRGISNYRFQITILSIGISNVGFGTWNLEFEIWNLESGLAERPSLGLPIFGVDYRVDATAHIEVTNNGHPSRTARLHEIIQYFIDDRFVKSALVAIGPKVKL